MTNLAYKQIRRHGLGDVLREQRRSRANLMAAVEGDLRLTYRQLDQRVNRLASALRAHDIGAGDRILWLGQNSIKLYELILAGAKLGAVVCPANWRQSVAEIGTVVRDFAPKAVFWQEAELGDKHRHHKSEWQIASILWVQHDGDGADGYDALLAQGEELDIEHPVDPEEALLAFYTAAFDGRPNAALLSHTALMIQGLLSARGQSVDENTRYLVSGPMFHIGVLMGALATFLSGGCCVFVSRIEPEPILQLIEQERVTHAFLPQPVIEPMRKLNAGGRYDVSSLFAQPDLSDWRSPIVLPPGAPLQNPNVYGQTEMTGISVMAWLGGSGAGRPSPFIQVVILDERGDEVADGQVGEIAVRGMLVMNGYHNRPKENSARSRDGWHRTRDLGKRLPDGSLAFIGPKTTMIKTGVENVYPGEVEACIRHHPAVADVCVIGVPDPEWDQRVKAVVCVRPGRQVTAQEIIEHCRAAIASYKKPSLVEFVDALPRGAEGQLDRLAVDAAHGGGGYPAVGS